MELVFDMVSAPQPLDGSAASKTFRLAGGIIGRAEGCDWVLPDRNRVVSGKHAMVTFDNGAFYLTDTSSNGIHLKDSGMPMVKGEPVRIEHGQVFCLGDYQIRARLRQDPSEFDSALPHSQSTGNIIPDDAFLDLDPLNALDQQEERQYRDELSWGLPAESAEQPHDYARIDMERLPVPELVPPPAAPVEPPVSTVEPALTDTFWARYSQALGVSLDGLPDDQREALAIAAATLLRQCVSHLQQSLKTRSELKSELRLAQTTVQTAGNNPLKHAADSSEALTLMLRGGEPGQLSATQAVARGYRDLQAHQVALSAASRAALRGMLEHFSPEQLNLRFEREGKGLLNTNGARWKAYTRFHQAIQAEEDWSKRLFARDFANAYEEQIRLIATLNMDTQG